MISARCAAFAFSLEACLAVGPLTAAPIDKSDISIRTPAAEITVDIADELKRDPKLAADLLAEGRRFAAKARAEADQEFKTNSEWFKGNRRWTSERIYSFRSLVADRYVSIVRHDGTYTGGAHPNSLTNTILWDRKIGKRISIRPFFQETADNGPTLTALAKLVRREVAIQKLERWKDADPKDDRVRTMSPGNFAEADDWIVRGVQPQLLKIGPVTLAPSTSPGKSSGLTFHFSPYDVDAYAAGPYTVFVPWTAFKTSLSPEGALIFGGRRPERDDP